MNEAALMMFLQSVEDRLRPRGLSSETPVLSLSKSGWQMSFRMRDINNAPDGFASLVHWTIIGASSIELMENVNRWIENYEPPKKMETVADTSKMSDDRLAKHAQAWWDAALKEPKPKKLAGGLSYRDLNTAYQMNPRNYRK